MRGLLQWRKQETNKYKCFTQNTGNKEKESFNLAERKLKIIEIKTK